MIAVIAGLPGSGKTWFLTTLAAKFLKAGRNVYCNFEIRKPESEDWPGEIKRIRTLNELLDVESGEVLLDEVHQYFNKDDWDKLPPDLKSLLCQHRKKGLNIWGTVQDYSRITIDYRLLIARYFSCSRFWRFIYIREYRFIINAQTQTIEGARAIRRWLQFMPVNPGEAFIKILKREVWRLAKLVPAMYDTNSIIDRPDDAPHREGKPKKR